MCQHIYLPLMQTRDQITTPHSIPGQLNQVRCRKTDKEHYYNYCCRHAQTLQKSQFLSSNNQHYDLRTLLLRNRNMIVPVRRSSYLSFIFTASVLLLLTNFAHVVRSHNCQHLHPKANEVIHGVKIETVETTTNSLDHTQEQQQEQLRKDDFDTLTHLYESRRKKRSVVERPLRISLVYDDSVLGLDSDKFILINDTVLPEAIQFWEQALMVRQTKGPIRLNRKCNSVKVFVKNGLTHCIDNCKSVTMCGEVQVPEEHLDVCRICNTTGQMCRVDETTQAGEGIEESDFVFYVSARQTERCHKGLTVAYAAHCQQEATLDRPIAGHANLCPNSISTKPQELQTLISTVKHEILHALGFSVSLFAFFRDDEGKPRTPRIPDTGKPQLNEIHCNLPLAELRHLTGKHAHGVTFDLTIEHIWEGLERNVQKQHEIRSKPQLNKAGASGRVEQTNQQIHQWGNKTIRKVIRDNWSVRKGHVRREIDMMVTPRVVAEVRKHFNCDLLEGAELEDQGGEGTALTHWEKRILENEAMTGTHTQSPVFSRITLALMEDSGWYRANYSMASPLSWGRGLGCNFVMRSCKDWIQLNNAKGRSIHPFCSKVKQDPLQTECTDDRNSVALCNLIRHNNELPEQYQNFDSVNNIVDGEEGYYGGSVSLADHCPYIQEFTWRNNNVTIRGSHCHFVENNPTAAKNYALESYGQGSKCFDHGDAMWEERTCHHTREWQHWGSGCYKYNCSDGRLHIQVGNYTYTCYFPGQRLSISISANGWLHRGALICPSCEELCREHFGARDEQCRLREEAPPLNKYPQDHLRCGALSLQQPLQQYLPFTIALLSLLISSAIINAIRQR